MSTSTSISFAFSDFISCALVLIHSLINSFKTTTLDIISYDHFQKAFSSTNVLILLSIALTIFAIFTLTSEIKESLALNRLNSNNNNESASDISMSNINSANTNKHIEDFSVPIDPGEIASKLLNHELESTSGSEIDDSEVHEEGLSQSLKSTHIPFEYYLKWDLTVEELEGLNYSEKARRFYILTNQGEFVKENKYSQALESQSQEVSVVALSEQANETETPKVSQEISQLAVVPLKPMNYLRDLKIQCDEFDVHKIKFIIMKKNSKLSMSFLKKLDKFQLKSRLCINHHKRQDETAALEPQIKLLLLKSRIEAKVESESETQAIKSLVSSDSAILNTTANTRQHDMLTKVVARLTEQQFKSLIGFITQFTALSSSYENKSNTKTKFKIDHNLLKSLCHLTLHRKSNLMASTNRNLRRPKH